MTKSFFDRRVEKRSLSGAKTRLFKEVYRKMAKSDGQFIFLSFLRNAEKINLSFVVDYFFSWRGEKRSLSGAKPRLFNEDREKKNQYRW